MTLTAPVDANVLVNAALRDTFLRADEAECYQIRPSVGTLEESKLLDYSVVIAYEEERDRG